MEELQAKMQENVQAMDPEAMMKTWFPAALQNMSDMQKMFWGQMGLKTGEPE